MTETSDPQLHLKKKARRRLVGAVAIAALAAVILPMVMDEEPKPLEQGIEIRIPGQDQPPFDAKELAARSSPSAAVMVAPDAPDAPDAHDAAPLADTAAKPVTAAAAEEAADTRASRAAEKAAEKKAAEKKAAEKKAAEKQAAEKQATKPVEKPPLKKVEKAPEAPPPPTASNGQYVILIGAFADPGNVKKLLVRIDGAGVANYTEILNSPAGQRTRVRAGPFANREAAEKALEKLQRIGVGGVVAGRS